MKRIKWLLSNLGSPVKKKEVTRIFNFCLQELFSICQVTDGKGERKALPSEEKQEQEKNEPMGVRLDGVLFFPFL
jgi:hypothetical protein